MNGSDIRGEVISSSLVEYGPSSFDHEMTIYSYLEFEGFGRLHNVLVLADIDTKLKASLGKEGIKFRVLHSFNPVKGIPTVILLAITNEEDITYVVDLKRLGVGDFLVNSQKMANFGIAVRVFGALLFIIGIPLLIFVIGAVLIPAGVALWVYGGKLVKVHKSNQALSSAVDLMIKSAPNVRYL